METEVDQTQRQDAVATSFIRKFSGGILWNQLGKLFEVLISFLLSLLLARGLAPANYGLYLSVLGMSSIVIVFARLGLGDAVLAWVPRLQEKGLRKDVGHIVRTASALRFLIVGLLVVLGALASDKIAGWLFHDHNVAGYVKVGLVYVFFTSLGELLYSFRMAQWDFRFTAIASGLSQGVGFSLAALVLLAGAGVWGALWATVASSVLLLSVCAWRSREELSGLGSRVSVAPFAKFALIMWIGSWVNYALGNQVDILFLNMYGVAQSDIAYYGIAYSLTMKVANLLFLGIGPLVLTVFSQLYASKGPEVVGRVWGLGVRSSVAIALPLVVFVAVNAHFIIQFLYSDAYVEAASLMQFFSALMLVAWGVGGGFNMIALNAAGKENTELKLRLLAGGLNILLDLVLIPTYGAAGALLATGSATALVTFLEMRIVSRTLGGVFPIRFLAKIGGAIGLAVVSLRVFQVNSFLSLIQAGFLYAGVFVLGLWILKPLDKESVRFLVRVDGRLRAVCQYFARI